MLPAASDLDITLHMSGGLSFMSSIQILNTCPGGGGAVRCPRILVINCGARDDAMPIGCPK